MAKIIKICCLYKYNKIQPFFSFTNVGSVADVLVGQAKVAFEASDFTKFESLLLRAQRPELAVKQYRDSGMWPEALRLCKEYLPHKLRSLQVQIKYRLNSLFTRLSSQNI
jgi:intraflagellar transport protein 172